MPFSDKWAAWDLQDEKKCILVVLILCFICLNILLLLTALPLALGFEPFFIPRDAIVDMTEIEGRIAFPEDSRDSIVSISTSNGVVGVGSIVFQYYILTSAHCGRSNVTGLAISPLTLKRENSKEERQVVFTAHPDGFNRRPFGNEIALMKIDKPFMNAHEYLQRMVPENYQQNPADTLQTIWTDENNRHQMAEVVLIEREKCKLNKRIRDFIDEEICAELLHTQRYCFLELGAPLLIGDLQIGFATREADCFNNEPIVYTHVRRHFSWVQQHLQTIDVPMSE